MNILKINTTPSFEIVPRLPVTAVRLELINEFSQVTQTILGSAIVLPNENHLLTLAEFPEGNERDKFSYTMYDNLTDVVVSLGRLMIVAEDADIQDYTTHKNNKYYE